MLQYWDWTLSLFYRSCQNWKYLMDFLGLCGTLSKTCKPDQRQMARTNFCLKLTTRIFQVWACQTQGEWLNSDLQSVLFVISGKKKPPHTPGLKPMEEFHVTPDCQHGYDVCDYVQSLDNVSYDEISNMLSQATHQFRMSPRHVKRHDTILGLLR